MSSNAALFRSALILGIGVAAGFGLGRLGGSSGDPGAGLRPARAVTVGTVATAGTPPAGAEAPVSGRSPSDAAAFRRAAASAIMAARNDDLRSALRGLVAVGDPGVRGAAVKEFIRSLRGDQLAVVLDAFEAVEGQFRSHQNSSRAAASTWEMIAAAIVDRGPEEFLDAKLRKAGEQASETDFESVLSAWADRDLGATVAYFKANIATLTPSEMEGAAGHLATNYFRIDPENAVKWLQTLPPDVQARCSHYALTDLCQHDPAAAASVLARHDSLPQRAELAREIANRYAEVDPVNALEWARQLPEEMAGFAVRNVITEWMETDFAAASARLATLDTPYPTAVLPGLAENVPADDLPALAARLGEGPGDDHQRSAAAALAARWTQDDAMSASQWLVSQPSGPVRDSAIRAFADTLAKDDPASAYEWAATISDADLRGDALDEGIRDWIERDPDAAREWVQTSTTLSGDDRARLLRRTGR